MTAEPDGDLRSYEVIHVGGEAAAIVPLPELRRLQAVQRHASAELLEDAEGGRRRVMTRERLEVFLQKTAS